MKTVICEKCGTEYDESLKECPICALTKIEKRESHVINLKWFYSLALFLIGSFGLHIIAFKLTHVFASYAYENYYSGLVNFTGYFILFAFLLTAVIANLDLFIKPFKERMQYFYGICMGCLVLFGSVTISFIINLIHTIDNNANETAIRSVISVSPVLSIIVFGLIGPICEELTYRAGLFTLINKKNRILAYILTVILFGFIHFDYTNIGSLNEWLNLPIYCFSGFVFTFTYDHFGLPAAITAHMTNNLISVFLNIIV